MKKIIQHIRDYAYLKYFKKDNIKYDQSMDYLFKFSIALIQFVFFFFFGILAFLTPYLHFLIKNSTIIILASIIIVLPSSYYLSKLIIKKTESPIGKTFTKKEITKKAIWYYCCTLGLFLFTVLYAFLLTYIKHGHI
jgi:hypothetical protein